MTIVAVTTGALNGGIGMGIAVIATAAQAAATAMAFGTRWPPLVQAR